MKKIIVFSIAIILCSFTARSQQIPLYSQYMMNGFLLNPAMAGSNDYMPIRLTARDQWEGLNGTIITGAISAHSPVGIGKQHGVGGYIYSDIVGPISRTGFMGAYAYHLKFDGIDSKLGLGLSMSAFQYVVDESDLNLLDDGDEVITGTKESTFSPDANFGAYFYNSKYYIGFAANQLLPIDVGINGRNKNEMIRHYFLMGGYIFNLNEDFDLEPSLLAKATEKTPAQLDVNLKAYYKKNYWLGFSYRTSNALVCILGVKVDKLYFGYSFDYTFGTIKNYAEYGSHEIMIGFNIGEGTQTGSTLL